MDRKRKDDDSNRTVLHVYSGHETQHIRGVGIVLGREASRALIGWKPVNDRIITARFQSRHTKTTIVQVYAPTEEADDETKDAFYDQLQATFDCIPSHDLKMVIGDLNAQINQDRQGVEHLIGPFGSAGRTSGNGERLKLFCNINNLAIGNTFFQHKNIHKKTWRSPDGNTKNEIDYICIDQRWRSSLKDVRVCRGADVGSDHHLLRAKVLLRLKKLSRQTRIKPFAVEKLEDPTVSQQFKITLQNRFQQLQDSGQDLEEQWTMFKEAVSESAELTIGRRRGSRREQWIKEDTWNLIDERKKAKAERDRAKTRDEEKRRDDNYRMLDRKVKRKCRRDKRAWIEKKGTEAEEAASRNDAKTLYRIVRELTGTRSNSSVPIKDKSGRILLSDVEQDERWMEHFRETLNQTSPTDTHSFDQVTDVVQLQVPEDEITENETAEAVKIMKK